ncbi:uncharacterized protein IL334_007251 [Kwoniella shivajii]|uniref:Transmembrane protein n=1 Tax=Kwoniella shivajii TaxID=564305 RepID=A0ABZ1D863_9TREE|nr:hypothetical protein IL334_007251 [Kwoniella shivajii]
MNITIDDTSPQFQYVSKNGTWLQDHTSDDQTSKYFHQTFYATHTEGDSASLTFNGTSVAIYGARRFNHGYYSAQLDGGTISYQSGYSVNQSIQQLLFQAGGLSADTEHTVVLTNTPSRNTQVPTSADQGWFDIDFAVITTSTQGKVFTTSYDDGSSAVQYFGSGWAVGNPNKLYYNTTVHVSGRATDLMQLKFNGSSIQVFGGLYTDHGNYSISIDDGPEKRYNGTFYKLQSQTPLYTSSHLSDGPHTLTMVNLGGTKGNYLDFDYAVVNSTVDPSGSTDNTTGTNTTTSTPESGGSSSSSSNVGAIAGGVVGGVVGLALVLLLAWFLFRRKRRNHEGLPYLMKTKEPLDLNGEEVKPFQYGENYHQPIPSSSSSNEGETFSGFAQPSHGLSPGSDTTREHNHSNTPFLTQLPPPPPSNATSYPQSENPPSSIGRSPTINERNNTQVPFSQTPSAATFGHSQSTTPGNQEGLSQREGEVAPPLPATRNSAKSAGLALPFTALPPMPSSRLSLYDDPTTPTTPTVPQPSFASPDRERAPSITSTRRMFVEGREQDMGPLGLHQHEPEDTFGPLPPDYQQATEPLPGQRRD